MVGGWDLFVSFFHINICVQLPSQERIVQLAVELANEFGDHDCGVLCVFLLNYVELQPGQGLFLAANEPHAYLRFQFLRF